ncbi:MAG: type II toxin-antitoxin system ParD family antitoxin [Alphaproteobacteria bacterium]|nr:type II toxin-antitoxin system ParD family antitoxin [Alphaproteobacteria bacterium]
MVTMNVSLPDPLKEWVEIQVKGGEYASVSDYIRDLIRHDQQRQHVLETAIAEGLESGRSQRNADAILAEIKARLRNG